MWPLIAMAGMSVLKSVGSMSQQQEQAKMQEAFRKAKNAQLARTAYRSIGITNENKIRAAQASMSLAESIQRDEFSAMGQAEASAGTSGVMGRSVDQTFSNINREFARQEFKRQEDLQGAFIAAEQEAQNTWNSAWNQMDHTPVQKPNTTLGMIDALTGLGGGIFAMTQGQNGTSLQSPTSGIGGMFNDVKNWWNYNTAGGGTVGQSMDGDRSGGIGVANRLAPARGSR